MLAAAAPGGRGARRGARRGRHPACEPRLDRGELAGRLAEFVDGLPGDTSRLLKPTGFVPPPYPYDRLDELRGARGRPRRRRRRPLGRHARATRRPRRCVDALASSDAERGYPPSIGTVAAAGRGERAGSTAGSALRRASRTSPPASAPRSSWATLPQWLRLRDPDRDTVLYPAVALPDLRDGADARRLPGRARARRRPTGGSISPPSTRATPPGRSACGSTRPATRPGRSTTSRPPPTGAGPTACRCSATSATSSSPGTARRARSWSTARRRGRGALAVEALEPGRRARRLLRRRPRPRALPVRGAQARRADGARAGAGGGGRRAGRRRARRGAAGALPRAAGAGRQGARGWRAHRPLPEGGFYLWVPAPDGDGWAFTPRACRGRRAHLSARASSTGAGADHVRVAVVQPDDRIDLVARRLRIDARATLRRMADLQAQIEELWERRSELEPGDNVGSADRARGRSICSTPVRPGRRGGRRAEVVVHQWLKQAILLLFRLSQDGDHRARARSSTPTRSR